MHESTGNMQHTTMGERRFGRVNWLGLYTLAAREVMRFWAVWTQTVLAPLITAALFLMISAGHAVLVVFGLTRMRARPTRKDRTRYVYAPRTSFQVGRLLGRSREK